MRLFKSITCSGLMLLILASFSQCSGTKDMNVVSAQNSEKKNLNGFNQTIPVEMGSIQFQKWVSGIQGGGSGIHMYINLISNKNNVQLDSIHFRGFRAKIEIGKMNLFASIKTPQNTKEKGAMSNDEHGEYGNSATDISLKSQFTLKDNTCVISYLEKDRIKYFKIENLIEKQQEYYPSSPSKD